MPEETAMTDARCMYCGERVHAAKGAGKPVANGSHPGGPNACIALALVKLRKALRSRLQKPAAAGR